jgi:flagellar hook assembly protein FlgD
MHIPVAVPAGGGAAHLDLLDASGRLVRRFDLGSVTPGIVSLPWDGRNDAGHTCAPGVYRALLVAPGKTASVLVARAP